MGFPGFKGLHSQNVDFHIIQSAGIDDDEIIASPMWLSPRENAGAGVEVGRFVGYADEINDQF